MEDVTAATIQHDQDEREGEGKKREDVDYAKLEQGVAEARELAGKGNLQGALDALLALEKRQRMAEDVVGTRLCCTAVCEVLYAARDWKQLNEHILLLAKRRSQFKQAVTAYVRQCMQYLDEAPSTELRVELIKTLQSVAEGKIYLEIERARLTRRLAVILEGEGKAAEAAETLQELAVETYGAMAKEEKVFFILEQVRLCLLRKDYVRAQILAKKVTPRALVETPGKGQLAGEVGIEGSVIQAPDAGTPPLAELRTRYYQLLIQFHQHENNYLEVHRCYRALYDAAVAAEDPAPDSWQPLLRKMCWYVVLAAVSSDQQTLLGHTRGERRLAELPAHADLLRAFATREILWWRQLQEKHSADMAGEPDIFGGEGGAAATQALRGRVTEHNVLTVAAYYRRLTLPRLAALLDLPQAEAEQALCDMVVAGAVGARVDRLGGIVRFAAPRAPSALLNEWGAAIAKLLQVVERLTQDIQKESLVHKVPLSVA